MDIGRIDLRGLKVLVVEDEALLAFDLESLLREQGCEVIGAASSNGECLELLERQRPDVALVDAKLVDGLALPIAGAFRSMGIPFVLVSGLNGVELDDPLFQGVPQVAKPYRSAAVLAALAQAVAGAAAGDVDSAA